MTMLADAPSLGILIGLPIAALFFVAAVAVAIIARRSDDVDSGIFFWGGVIVAIATVVVTALAMWPWGYDYHFWRPVNGKVQRVSSRFISAGDKGGTNQRFVVVIHGQPYGVDDTRAALLKPGDTVHLSCKREYQWGSSDNGYGCRWNG